MLAKRLTEMANSKNYRRIYDEMDLLLKYKNRRSVSEHSSNGRFIDYPDRCAFHMQILVFFRRVNSRIFIRPNDW